MRAMVELDGRRRDGTRDAAREALEQAVIGNTMIFYCTSNQLSELPERPARVGATIKK